MGRSKAVFLAIEADKKEEYSTFHMEKQKESNRLSIPAIKVPYYARYPMVCHMR